MSRSTGIGYKKKACLWGSYVLGRLEVIFHLLIYEESHECRIELTYVYFFSHISQGIQNMMKQFQAGAAGNFPGGMPGMPPGMGGMFGGE